MTMILNIIKEHHEDLCTNKCDNADEMGWGTQAKLVRQEEIEVLNQLL